MLAIAAGWVDAVSYLTLNVFTAHMSGNSARLGVFVSRGDVTTTLLTLFAICLFVVAVAFGAIVMEIGERRRYAPGIALLGVEALLIASFAGVAAAFAQHGKIPDARLGLRYGLVACCVVAMALQTAALQRVSGRTVRTTYVTGMLTNLADGAVALVLGRRDDHDGYLESHLRMRPTPSTRGRVGLLAAVWLCYAAGAISGGLLHRAWGPGCTFVPALLVATVAVLERWRRRSASTTAADLPARESSRA